MSDLTARAAQINDMIDEADSLAMSAIEKAREIGSALLDVKEELPHGDFSAWVGKNIPVGIRQCQKYMKIARAELPNAHPSSFLNPPKTINEATGNPGKPKHPKPKDPEELPELSMTAQQKVDAYKRRLDKEFEERVSFEVVHRVTPLLEKLLPKRLADFEESHKIIEARKGVFTHAEYKTMLSLFHTDKYGDIDDGLKKKLNTAFDTFRKNKNFLCKPKPRPVSPEWLELSKKLKEHLRKGTVEEYKDQVKKDRKQACKETPITTEDMWTG